MILKYFNLKNLLTAFCTLFIVSFFSAQTVSLGGDITMCSGSNYTIDAKNPGAAYSWSTGATTRKITVNSTGVYSVTVHINNSSSSDTINITVNTCPTSITVPRLAYLSINPFAEISGMEYKGTPNNLWGHNDAGTAYEKMLFKFDTSGVVSRTIQINGVNNRDWEDITQSQDEKYFFISETGDNNNVNRPKWIYRIPNPDSIVGSSYTVTNADKIQFEYPDITNNGNIYYDGTIYTGFNGQTLSTGNHQFDCEGIFHYGCYIWIFSKNRGGGWEKLYRIPDQPGTYTAELVDSRDMGGIQITGADISPDGKTVILISDGSPDRIVLLYNYQGTDFFGGDMKILTIANDNEQREAIVFASNTTGYLASEAPSLWSFDVGPWLPSGMDPAPPCNLDVDLGVDRVICQGESVILDAGIPPGNPQRSYLWSNGATTQTITATTTGIYSATIISCSCQAEDTVSVIVNNLPIINILGNTAICNGNAVTLTASGANAYNWSTGDTNAIVNLTPVVTTGYSVIGTDTNNCSDTTAVTITVNPLPSVSLALSGTDTLCSNSGIVTLTGATPSGGVFSGSGVTGNTFNPTIAAAGWNKISYSYTDNNNCTSVEEDSLYVQACTGIQMMNGKRQYFTIYPNPSLNNTISVSSWAGNASTLTITNVLGALIQKEEIPSDTLYQQEYTLGRGIYFVTLTLSSGEKETQKIFIP